MRVSQRTLLSQIMYTQFEVWRGVENATEILEDVCRTLGVNVLEIPVSNNDTTELERFVAECKG